MSNIAEPDFDQVTVSRADLAAVLAAAPRTEEWNRLTDVVLGQTLGSEVRR